MKNDILIIGGYIIDFVCNINEINNLCIINDIIVDVDKYFVILEIWIIYVDGMIVIFGFIDYYVYVFYDVMEGGVRFDMYMLLNGVIIVVDVGFVGMVNFDVFY